MQRTATGRKCEWKGRYQQHKCTDKFSTFLLFGIAHSIGAFDTEFRQSENTKFSEHDAPRFPRRAFILLQISADRFHRITHRRVREPTRRAASP